MGMFSFLDKPFRTGRSAANREAKRAAAKQDVQTQQFIDMVRPAFEEGLGQLRGLGTELREGPDFSDPQELAGLFSDISGSDLASEISAERIRAAEQALASAGLRRSGGRIRQAGDIRTGSILGLMDTIFGQRQQRFQNRQNLASLGLNQGARILPAIGGLGRRAQASQQAAAQKIDILGGVAELGLKAASLSDERVKENITKIGETDNGINIYAYNYVGHDDLYIGVIAQEVKEKIPEATRLRPDGLLEVNYEAIAA